MTKAAEDTIFVLMWSRIMEGCTVETAGERYVDSGSD